MSDDVTNWHAYHEHEHNDSPAEQSGRYSLRDEITEMVGVIMTAGEGLTPEWKTITWEPPPAPWLAEIEAMRLAYNAAIDMHGALIAELDKRQAGLDVRLKAIEAIQRAAGDPDVYDMYMCNSDACGWAGMGWECAHQPHDPAC